MNLNMGYCELDGYHFDLSQAMESSTLLNCWHIVILEEYIPWHETGHSISSKQSDPQERRKKFMRFAWEYPCHRRYLQSRCSPSISETTNIN